MKFHHWVTDYDNYCQFMGKSAAPHHVFFPKRLEEIRQAKGKGIQVLLMMAEKQWMELSRPYYNIHPGLVSKLARINLSKVPSHLVTTPHDFSVVNIRFAERNEALVLKAGMPKQGGLVEIPPDSSLHGILMVDCRKLPVGFGQNRVSFYLDFNVWAKRLFEGQWQRLPQYCHFCFDIDLAKSLQEAIDECVRPYTDESYYNLCTNALRLAVSIGFLSNSSAELVEYDVISRFRERFRQGNEKERQQIIEKSRRRGKVGYNVGNDLIFSGRIPTISERRGELTGRELTYASIRQGHPHAVRYGKGKELVKIMWFAPTVVRPDLPFRPD